MPPGHGDDGLVAAQEIRRRHPNVGVLVLSHYLDSRYAARLLEEVPAGAGYLLKDRISEVAVVADALRRIDEGECVIDPTIVSRLVARKRARGPLDVLTEREREVLALVAEGRSNGAIGEKLSCRVRPSTLTSRRSSSSSTCASLPSSTDECWQSLHSFAPAEVPPRSPSPGPDHEGVCCIERSEKILTGNPTGGTPPGCFLAVPARPRRAGQGALGGVLAVNLPGKITCDRSMQQTLWESHNHHLPRAVSWHLSCPGR
jgi:FixJ family two-component response regulator